MEIAVPQRRRAEAEKPGLPRPNEEEAGGTKRGSALVTTASLCEAAKKGEIAYVRVCPANHHSGYFEAVYRPTGAEGHAVNDEIEGNHPLCPHCALPRATECVGHRIGLVLPFYMVQPQYEGVLIKFLNAVCLNLVFLPNGAYQLQGCCAPRSGRPRPGSTISESLNATSSACKVCGSVRPDKYTNARFVTDRHGGLSYHNKAQGRHPETPLSINAVMDYLTRHETQMLRSAEHYGLNIDVRHLVTNKLYIPPPQLRPAAPGRPNFETQTYKHILDACRTVPYPEIPDSIKSPTAARRPAAQSVVETIYATIMRVMVQKAKSPDQETLYHGNSTKHGHIRAHVTSTYCGNIGRSVVAPAGVDLYQGEFGIPFHFQMLNTSEIANRYNIGRLRRLGEEGLVTWVMRRGGGTDKYRPGTDINLGDTVWRQLLSGDPVVANRQPTLHRFSLMSHNAIIHSSAVVRLPPSCTTPYNADFDGDEMNVIPGPSQPSQLELMSIAHATNNTFGSGAPAMAPVFHELAVLYIFSVLAPLAVGPKEAELYMAALTPSADLARRTASYPARRERRFPGTGGATIGTYRDVLSLLFPEDFYYNSRGVLIEDGVFLKGELKKSNVGLAAGSITHAFMGYPRKRASLFINDCVRACAAYLSYRPVSLNPLHLLHDGAYNHKVMKIADSTRIPLLRALQAKEAAVSPLEAAHLESTIVLLAQAPINQIMTKLGDDKGEEEAVRQKALDAGATPAEADAAYRRAMTDNVFKVMYRSGCRGSTRTVTQMSSTLGVQFTGTERSTAHGVPLIHNPSAPKLSNGRPYPNLLANGIIDSSFNRGLSPGEMAVHAAGIRWQVVRGKLDVATAGVYSKGMNGCFEQIRVEGDLAVVSGRVKLSHAPAGFLDPARTRPTSQHGHGISTFVDIEQLVARANYATRGLAAR